MQSFFTACIQLLFWALTVVQSFPKEALSVGVTALCFNAGSFCQGLGRTVQYTKTSAWPKASFGWSMQTMHYPANIDNFITSKQLSEKQQKLENKVIVG